MNNKLCAAGSGMSKKSWWLWSGLGLFTLYALLTVTRCSPIEQDIQSRTNAALTEKGYDWASASLTERGRDTLLSGIAPSESARDDAIKTAADIYGARSVTHNITLKQYDSPSFNLTNRDGKTLLTGNLPDQGLIDKMLRAASDQFGAGNVVNRMVLSDDVSSPAWFASSIAILPTITDMKDAVFDINDKGSTLNGTFHTDKEKQFFLKVAAEKLGDTLQETTVVMPLGPTPEELAEIARKAEEAEAERLAKEAEAARIAEEKRLAKEEAARIAEEKRLTEEAENARLAEEKRLAEEEVARIAEEKRIAEEVEEKRLAEEAENVRLAEEAEAARIAEEKRLAEEAEAARIAEEKRLAEEAEAARIAEEKRLAEEAEAARIAEEKRLAEETEAARVAEEKRLAEEAEATRIAEEKRLAEETEAARIAEEKRLAEEAEAARIAEEKRLAEEAEAARIAEEKRLAEEAEAARIAEEKRLAEEAEAARIAEEKRLAEEAEAARLAEVAAQQKRLKEVQKCQDQINSVMKGKTILFASSSAEIDRKSHPLLNTMSLELRRCSDTILSNTQHVEISGHTDSRGSEEMNLKLSDERARSVRSYLLNSGVRGSVLVSKGYGESNPVADNNTAAGRRQNRRIQFTIQ